VEDTKEEKKSRQTIRRTVIALAGTLLTVCGGLGGAALSAGITIYKTEREVQQVALSAPDSEQTLNIDTRQIAISTGEAQQLDPNTYYAAIDDGFVLAQPRAGWGPLEEMTYADLFSEEGSALSPLILFYSKIEFAWDEQPVYRIRYQEPVQVQYIEGALENGVAIDVEQLHSDTAAYYSQITILAVDKAVAQNYTLADIALTWGTFHWGAVNHIIANRESDYILMQTTWRLENVRADGQEADLAIERWALFAEGPQHYYLVEVNYVPRPDQRLQVWDDLQYYMGSFRVIQ
jgi:hypothetical protein